MGLLSKLFGRNEDSGPDLPINLAVDARRGQLAELEQSLDAVSRRMRERDDLMENPGWRARAAEYDRIAGEAMELRRGTPTREALLDLAFQVRPAVNGEPPAGMDDLTGLQDRAMAAANALVEVLPGERD